MRDLWYIILSHAKAGCEHKLMQNQFTELILNNALICGDIGVDTVHALNLNSCSNSIVLCNKILSLCGCVIEHLVPVFLSFRYMKVLSESVVTGSVCIYVCMCMCVCVFVEPLVQYLSGSLQSLPLPLAQVSLQKVTGNRQ